MLANCWEFKICGRQPGGRQVAELGVCPAATATRANGINGGKNGGRICWAIAGTLCATGPEGTCAVEEASCIACDFFKEVRRAAGRGRLRMTVPDHGRTLEVPAG